MTAAKKKQAEQPASEQSADRQPPIDTVRSGVVKGAIWERSGQTGTFYNVTFDRAYTEGEETKYTDMFRLSDLANVASAALQAEQRIAALRRDRERG